MNKLCRPLAWSVALTLAAPASSWADNTNKPASPGAVNTTVSQASAAAMNSVLLANLLGGAGVFRIQLGKSTVRPRTGLAAAGEPDTWTFWASPAYSQFNNNIAPITSKGSILLGLAGLEYNYQDQTIAGLSLAVDRLNGTTPYNSGTLDGSGYTLAPYLMHYLSPSVVLNASYGVGQIDFTSKAGGISSSPATSRTMLTVGLMRIDTKGKFFITSKATYNRFGSDTKSYAFSDGTSSAGLNSTLSQFMVGGQVAYDMTPLTPFVGIYQYFNDQTSTALSETPREYATSTQVILGLNASKGPFYGSLGYYAERDRSQVRTYFGLRF